MVKMIEETASIRQQLNVLQRSAAWKYVGYPGLSRFMASSTDCFSIRAFSHLNVRVLLKLQNDIVKLETKLMEMDVHSMNMPNDAEGNVQGGCGSFRLDESSPRGKLLEDIAEKLKDYSAWFGDLTELAYMLNITDQRLNEFLQLQDRPKSSFQQVQNLRLWLDNHPDAIEKDEREFLEKHDEDLLAVRTAQRTRFGRWMESLGVSKIASISGRASKDSTRYYDRGVWKSIGAFSVLFALIIMLLGPMWALPFAADSLQRLSIITGFILAFSLLVIIGTTLSSFQRMIIIAGYSTQLVFALGIIPPWKFTSESAMTMDPTRPSQIPAITTTSILATAVTSTPTSASISLSTATPYQTLSASNDHAHSTLNPAAIVGIVVGVLAGITFLIVLLFLCWCRRRRGSFNLRRDLPSELAETGSEKAVFEPSSLHCDTEYVKGPRNELDSECVSELPERRHLTLRIPGAIARHDATENRDSAFRRSNTSVPRFGLGRAESLTPAYTVSSDTADREQGSPVSYSESPRGCQQVRPATDLHDYESDYVKI